MIIPVIWIWALLTLHGRALSPDEVCTNSFFQNVQEQLVSLSKCGASGQGFLVPLPSRPICDKPTLQLPTTVISRVNVLKPDISLWSIPVVECKALKVTLTCTVYFFGAQEKHTTFEDYPMNKDECPFVASSKMLEGYKTSPKSSNILEKLDMEEFPCAWTGTSSSVYLRYYRIRSFATVSHKDGHIMGTNAVVGKCNANQKHCATGSGGWLALGDLSDTHTQCPLILSRRLVCTARLSVSSYSIQLNCKNTKLMFHIPVSSGSRGAPFHHAIRRTNPHYSVNAPVHYCPKKGPGDDDIQPQVYKTVEGYLIQLGYNHPNHTLPYDPLEALLRSLSSSQPSPMNPLTRPPGEGFSDAVDPQGHSFKVGYISFVRGIMTPHDVDTMANRGDTLHGLPEDSSVQSDLTISEIEWAISHLENLTLHQLSQEHHKDCELAQVVWDQMMALAPLRPSIVVRQLMNSRYWAGSFFRGFLEAWRCQKITRYRLLSNSGNTENWPVEYSDGTTLMTGYIKTPDLTIVDEPGRNFSRTHNLPFLFPWNSSAVINLVNDSCHFVSVTPLYSMFNPAEEDLIFSSPPLYSISELTSKDDIIDRLSLVEDQNYQLSQLMYTSGNIPDLHKYVKLRSNLSSIASSLTPNWTDPFSQLFGSLAGPLIRFIVIFFVLILTLILACGVLKNAFLRLLFKRRPVSRRTPARPFKTTKF